MVVSLQRFVHYRWKLQYLKGSTKTVTDLLDGGNKLSVSVRLFSLMDGTYIHEALVDFDSNFSTCCDESCRFFMSRRSFVPWKKTESLQNCFNNRIVRYCQKYLDRQSDFKIPKGGAQMKGFSHSFQTTQRAISQKNHKFASCFWIFSPKSSWQERTRVMEENGKGCQHSLRAFREFYDQIGPKMTHVHDLMFRLIPHNSREITAPTRPCSGQNYREYQVSFARLAFYFHAIFDYWKQHVLLPKYSCPWLVKIVNTNFHFRSTKEKCEQILIMWEVMTTITQWRYRKRSCCVQIIRYRLNWNCCQRIFDITGSSNTAVTLGKPSRRLESIVRWLTRTFDITSIFEVLCGPHNCNKISR